MQVVQARWMRQRRVLSLALLSGVTLTAASAPGGRPVLAQQEASAPAASTYTAAWLAVYDTWRCDAATAGGTHVASAATGLLAPGMLEAQVAVQAGGTAGGAANGCARTWQRRADGTYVAVMPGAARPLAVTALATATATPAPRIRATLAAAEAIAGAAAWQAPPPPPLPVGVPAAFAPVPGRGAYAMTDFAGDPYANLFGQCAWYVWYRQQSKPYLRLGNAAQWPMRAPAFGLQVSATPQAGAAVVFQPGVQGASAAGHAGYVETVLSDGWFILSEMNFSTNGGGWGRVSYRYAHAGPGVSFIW